MGGLSGNANSAASAELKLLANPQELAKRIEELERARDEAQKAIDLAGPASEILSIRKKIAEDQEVSARARREAEEAAGVILATANAEAEEVVAQARRDADAIRAEAEDVKSLANDVLSASTSERDRLAETKADLDERQRVVDHLKVTLDKKHEELRQRFVALETERERFNEYCGRVRAAMEDTP